MASVGSRAGPVVAAGGASTTSQAEKMATVRAVGKAGEVASGIIKNKESIIVNGRTRIPDGLDYGLKLLQEVKNVAALSYTSQMRDFVTYSQQRGLSMELFVRQNTNFTYPMLKAIVQNNINIKILGN